MLKKIHLWLVIAFLLSITVGIPISGPVHSDQNATVTNNGDTGAVAQFKNQDGSYHIQDVPPGQTIDIPPGTVQVRGYPGSLFQEGPMDLTVRDASGSQSNITEGGQKVRFGQPIPAVTAPETPPQTTSSTGTETGEGRMYFPEVPLEFSGLPESEVPIGYRAPLYGGPRGCSAYRFFGPGCVGIDQEAYDEAGAVDTGQEFIHPLMGPFRPLVPSGRDAQFADQMTVPRRDLDGFFGFADTIPTLSRELGQPVEQAQGDQR